MNTELVRSPNGTGRRVVDFNEIKMPNLALIAELVADLTPEPADYWSCTIGWLLEFPHTLATLLAAAKGETDVPETAHVPDFWNVAKFLPKPERETLLDVWGLGHDLAAHLNLKKGRCDTSQLELPQFGNMYVPDGSDRELKYRPRIVDGVVVAMVAGETEVANAF